LPKLLHLDPADLRPNKWNSNVVSPENERKLERAIERFGFFKPVVVREVDGVLEIIGGEHRWGAAKRLGMKEIPAVNLGPIDDKTAKEISIADNARYGADDSVLLAQLFEEIGLEDVQNFLPYSEVDTRELFSATDIALDDLELDEPEEAPAAEVSAPLPKAPKTHTIMRFKVPVTDAERLTALIAKTQKTHGFTTGDELTNAGDALVQLLLSESEL